MANTEGGRISHILEQAKRCALNENLAKARAYCNSDNYLGNRNVTSESAYLNSQLSCYNYVRESVVPESVRIARVQQTLLSKENDPMNSNTRFIEYAPAASNVPCPPITYMNGRIPDKCQLPNTPLNRSLPV